jgi:chromosomal replication initiator protein
VDGVVDQRGAGEAEAQVTDAERLWMACAEALRDQVSDSTWKTFFQGIRAVSLSSDRLGLAVPNPLVKERLEGRYLALVQDAVAGLAGGGVEVELEVRTDTDDELFDDDEPLTSENAGSSGTAPRSPAALTPLRPPPDGRTAQLPINPKYTFETFVIARASASACRAPPTRSTSTARCASSTRRRSCST